MARSRADRNHRPVRSVSVSQYLRRQQRWEQIFGYGERAAQRIGVTTDEEVADAVTQLRRSRRGR